MKTTIKKAGAIGFLSLGALGVLSASAMGMGGMLGKGMSAEEITTRQTAMFTEQASLIGATVDEVKNAWAEGKSLKDLAKEKGITDDQLKAKMKAQRDAQMKNFLSTLVSKGVITQAQADKRLVVIQAKEKTSTNDKSGKHGGMRGMMGGL